MEVKVQSTAIFIFYSFRKSQSRRDSYQDMHVCHRRSLAPSLK